MLLAWKPDPNHSVEEQETRKALRDAHKRGRNDARQALLQPAVTSAPPPPQTQSKTASKGPSSTHTKGPSSAVPPSATQSKAPPNTASPTATPTPPLSSVPFVKSPRAVPVALSRSDDVCVAALAAVVCHDAVETYAQQQMQLAIEDERDALERARQHAADERIRQLEAQLAQASAERVSSPQREDDYSVSHASGSSKRVRKSTNIIDMGSSSSSSSKKKEENGISSSDDQVDEKRSARKEKRRAREKEREKLKKKRQQAIDGIVQRRELKEGLGVFSLERSIAGVEMDTTGERRYRYLGDASNPHGRKGSESDASSVSTASSEAAAVPTEGREYGIHNTTSFSVVVTFNFTGSSNIAPEATESAAKRGATVLPSTEHTNLPYASELTSPEVNPGESLWVARIFPEDVYMPWTLSVATKWTLMEPVGFFERRPTPSRSGAQSASLERSIEQNGSAFSLTQHTLARINNNSVENDVKSFYRVDRAERELETLQKNAGRGKQASLVKVAMKQHIPFVDGEFMPSDRVSTEVGRDTTGWVRVEKLTKEDVLAALYPAEGFAWREEAFHAPLRWFVMGLSLMLDVYPDAVSALFPGIVSPDTQTRELSNVGGYEAWWCINGWWRKVTTDSYLPQPPLLPAITGRETKKRKSKSKTTEQTDCHFPDLILKSYAKVKAGYAKACYGVIGHFLQEATGCPYKRIPLCYAADEVRSRGGTQEGDMCVLWQDIKTHVDCGRLLALSKEETVQAKRNWRGDCDYELSTVTPLLPVHGDGLFTLPEDTSLPIIGYSEDHNDVLQSKLKLRNRFSPGYLHQGEPVDTWVTYRDVLLSFASLTISYVTPGWNDVRFKIRPDPNVNIFDTFFEVNLSAGDVPLHLWLGSFAQRASLLGVIVMKGTPNNKTASAFVCEDFIGVESSAHIWGEIELKSETDAPFLIVPLYLDCVEPSTVSFEHHPSHIPQRSVKNAISDYVLTMRAPEGEKNVNGSNAKFMNIQSRANSMDHVKSCELEAILAKGEAKVIGTAKTQGKVTLRLLQQYRWMGCAVSNGSDSPAEIRVSLEGSEGYRVIHTGEGVRRDSLSLTTSVPAYSQVLLCTMVADGDSWEYSLETSCRWMSSHEAVTYPPPAAEIAPTAHPLVAREVQINGDTQVRQLVKL